MKLGISSYTLTWSVGVPGYPKPQNPVTAVDLIALARSRGLSLLQIADNIPLHLMNEEELEHIAAAAREQNVELEIGTRGTEPEHLRTYLAIAGKLNATLFRTIINQPDTGLAEAHLREVLPEFEAAGVTIGVENHGMHTTGQLAKLFERIRSPFIGCCLDTVNSFSALEAPSQVIEALAPYIVNLHLKDFAIQRVDHQMGFVVLGTAAGSGRLDIPSLLERLQRLGKKPNSILELWTPYTNSVEDTIRLEVQWMEESLRYLKSFHFA